MERQAQKLTIDDKQKQEMQKEVFVLIRLIDMVERCSQLSYDRISSEEHNRQISKLLEKYELLKSKIPNFELQGFVINYNLDDCRFGIDRIKAGPPKIQDNSANKLVKLTAKFYLMQDLILNCQNSSPKVSELSVCYGELTDLLLQAQSQLPPYTSHSKEMKDFNERVFKIKYLTDILTEEEFNELSTIVEQAQLNFLRVNS